MARHLRRQGYSVGRKRISRLMRLMGLSPIDQKSNTSKPHPQHKVYPYLLRGLTIDTPNHVWRARPCNVMVSPRSSTPIRVASLLAMRSPAF